MFSVSKSTQNLIPPASIIIRHKSNLLHVRKVRCMRITFHSHANVFVCHVSQIVYKFMLHNADWLMGELGVEGARGSVHVPAERPAPPPLLHAMFHIGTRTFDEVS
jgi:hypothetical protein